MKIISLRDDLLTIHLLSGSINHLFGLALPCHLILYVAIKLHGPSIIIPLFIPSDNLNRMDVISSIISHILTSPLFVLILVVPKVGSNSCCRSYSLDSYITLFMSYTN